MTHDELESLLGAYALGTASPEERAAVKAHARHGCDSCRRALRDFRFVASWLPSSVEPIQPRLELKERLMFRLDERPRWRGISPLALAAGFLVMVAGGLLPWSYAPPMEAVRVEGRLTADGRPVAAGDRVRLGQRLAAAEGPADLRLAKRFALRMNAGTEMTVSQVGSRYVVRLEKGGVLSAVKTGTSYLVKTPLLMTNSLGTLFYVETSDPDHSSLCLCRGRVLLLAPGFQTVLETENHRGLTLQATNGVTTPFSPTSLNHSDQDAKDLSLLLAEKI